jgi:FkbM family methyltransferase
VAFEAYIRATGRTRVVRFGQSSRIVADLHHYSSVQAFHANPPDFESCQVWRRHLRPGDLFVDVGANIGLYTLWALEQGAEVIALEPDPAARARLRQHLEMNNAHAEVLPFAAGDTARRVAMTSGLDAANRLLLGTDGDVEMVTLDEVIGDRVVAGVKVDVEGAERLVVEGAATALAEHRIRLLQLEWNALSVGLLGETRESVIELLHEHRYKLYRANAEGQLSEHGDLSARAGAPDVFAAPTS